MSILVKGMEMPLACSNCAFCEESYFYVGAYCSISDDDDMMSINEIRSKRRDNCPLVPVPQHGRLIDADEAIGHLFIGEQCLYSWDEIEESVDATPTIIPADPAAEDE